MKNYTLTSIMMQFRHVVHVNQSLSDRVKVMYMSHRLQFIQDDDAKF